MKNRRTVFFFIMILWILPSLSFAANCLVLKHFTRYQKIGFETLGPHHRDFANAALTILTSTIFGSSENAPRELLRLVQHCTADAEIKVESSRWFQENVPHAMISGAVKVVEKDPSLQGGFLVSYGQIIRTWNAMVYIVKLHNRWAVRNHQANLVIAEDRFLEVSKAPELFYRFIRFMLHMPNILTYNSRAQVPITFETFMGDGFSRFIFQLTSRKSYAQPLNPKAATQFANGGLIGIATSTFLQAGKPFSWSDFLKHIDRAPQGHFKSWLRGHENLPDTRKLLKELALGKTSTRVRPAVLIYDVMALILELHGQWLIANGRQAEVITYEQFAANIADPEWIKTTFQKIWDISNAPTNSIPLTAARDE